VRVRGEQVAALQEQLAKQQAATIEATSQLEMQVNLACRWSCMHTLAPLTLSGIATWERDHLVAELHGIIQMPV